MKKFLTLLLVIFILVSSFCGCNINSDDKNLETTKTLEENKLSGFWYSIVSGSECVIEWVFYADKTCSSEYKYKGASQKDDLYYRVYEENGKDLIIYGYDIETGVAWSFDAETDCYYTTELSSGYKIKILHYDNQLSQTEIDEIIANASSYIVQGEKKSDYKKITNPIDLVEIWDSYSMNSICCESMSVNVSEIEELLTEQQKMMAIGAYKCICCHTVEEVEKHREYYIDSSLLYDISDNLVEYNQNVYIVRGGMGYFCHLYNEAEYIKNTEDEIILRVPREVDFIGDSIFTIKKIDGDYKITDVKEE